MTTIRCPGSHPQRGTIPSFLESQVLELPFRIKPHPRRCFAFPRGSPSMRKLLPLALSVILSFLASAANSQQFVTSRRVIPNPPPGFPDAPIYGVADFNGDGRLDFLTAVWNPSNSSIVTALLLQNSNGTFTQKDIPNVPTAATVVADLNGDGHADIVSAIPGPSNDHGDPLGPATLTIAFGNGNGTFRVLAPVNLVGDVGGTFVTIRDLNGDNKLDIVVVSSDQYGDANLQTFLNNGNSTFRAGPTYNHPLIGGNLLAKGDFNGDGKSDLVVQNNFEMLILLGNGDGSFTPGATYNVFPQFVGVGDLNRDHREDLVVVTLDNTEIMLGKGNGTFASSGTLPTSFGLNSTVDFYGQILPESLYVGDLNKDGIPDIAFASVSNTAEVAVYDGKGNGTFAPAKLYNIGGPYVADGGPAAFADFNHDGNLDVLSLSDSGGYTIAYGDGHGGFVAPAISQSLNPGSVGKGDFNRDGIEDIAVVNEPLCNTCATSVSIFLGTGKGYFRAPSTYTIPVHGGVILVGDVNGDGRLDVVVTRSGGIINNEIGTVAPGPDLAVLLGRGDGTIEAVHSYKLLGAPAKSTFNMSAFLVDVNHDGKLDLVGDWGTALGKGNGQFDAPIPLPSVIQGIVDLAPGDFNSSGHPGLAVATNTYNPVIQGTGPPSYIYVLDGSGTGSFVVKSRKSVGILTNLVTADLNGDGLSDILYTTQGTNNLTLGVELSKGNDTFSTATYLIPSPYATNGILTGDFDRDGKVDVVILGDFTNGGSIALLRGAGNGALLHTPQFYQGYLSSATVLDLNGDGAPDIAGTDTIGVTRLLNTGHKNP